MLHQPDLGPATLKRRKVRVVAKLIAEVQLAKELPKMLYTQCRFYPLSHGAVCLDLLLMFRMFTPGYCKGKTNGLIVCKKQSKLRHFTSEFLLKIFDEMYKESSQKNTFAQQLSPESEETAYIFYTNRVSMKTKWQSARGLPSFSIGPQLHFCYTCSLIYYGGIVSSFIHSTFIEHPTSPVLGLYG